MLFSSLSFLFWFLPITIILYYIIPNRRWRNGVLLLASLVFYSWGEPKYILLMIVEVFIAYLLSLLMPKTKHKRVLLFFSICICLIVLIYFKYTNFFIDVLNKCFHNEYEFFEIILPIGISFYTFQLISYVIDIYRNTCEVQRNPFKLLLYVSMFPQLIAGPIVRYETIEKQLNDRKESIKKVSVGIRRFIIGLGKKVILANNLAIIADYIFKELPFEEYTSGLCWLGAIAFTFQIYFDFSGYSDMAIGLGKIFGFDYLENFNYPYISTSITDFWRRWHISLGTWFRDYVYIPLGGNRKGLFRQIINILIVWLLTGFWHGADYNFIIWGLYFALILIIEKLFLLKALNKLYIIRNLYSLLLIVIGWVIFNSLSLEQIVIYLKTMFTALPIISLNELVDLNFTYLIIYFVFALIFSTPIFKIINDKCRNSIIYGIIRDTLIIAVLALSVMYLINNSYNPFLYFRF